jgi:hypothetical protein
MEEKPPFDLVRASFFLVAGVISVHLIVVTLGTMVCLFRMNAVGDCDPTGRLGEILAAALAAALAFAGGRMRGNDPPPPPPRIPPEK